MTTKTTLTSDAKRKSVIGPIHVFFVLFVLIAGGLFCFKLFAFFSTIKRDELAGFAFDPLLQYAFVALGFACLLGWAYLSGQFRNVEGPKIDMLENYYERERHDVALMDEDA